MFNQMKRRLLAPMVRWVPLVLLVNQFTKGNLQSFPCSLLAIFRASTVVLDRFFSFAELKGRDIPCSREAGRFALNLDGLIH